MKSTTTLREYHTPTIRQIALQSESVICAASPATDNSFDTQLEGITENNNYNFNW